jgi:hypothetical protein
VNGITFTGNLDHMYIGQWVENAPNLLSSAVIGWSNYGYDPITPDMMRLQYRETYDAVKLEN